MRAQPPSTTLVLAFLAVALGGCSAAPATSTGSPSDASCVPPADFQTGPPRVLFVVKPDDGVAAKAPWSKWRSFDEFGPNPKSTPATTAAGDWCFLAPLNEHGYASVGATYQPPGAEHCQYYAQERFTNASASVVHEEQVEILCT
jgi:hypothetical protein